MDPIHDALKNFERKQKLAEKDERDANRRANASLGVELSRQDSNDADITEVDSGYEGSEAEDEKKVDAAGADKAIRKRR